MSLAEPRPAATWRGVEPSKVQLSTLAFPWRQKGRALDSSRVNIWSLGGPAAGPSQTSTSSSRQPARDTLSVSVARWRGLRPQPRS